MLAIRIGLAAISTGLPSMSLISNGYGPGIASGVDIGSCSGVGSTAGGTVGVDIAVWAVAGTELGVGLGAGVGVGGLSVGATVAVGSTASSPHGPEFEHGAMTMTIASARNKDRTHTLFRVMMFNLVTQ